MAVINTTNVIDSSMYLKAKLPKNMVGENYYIENLQDKRNKDWAYRYNVVGIEEEIAKPLKYTCELPAYTPVDVVIRSVKGERGEDLGTDWEELSFRDLNYPIGVGKRYRFSLDFPDMTKMTEDEKHYDTSVWLAINENPVAPRRNCVVRRCNGNIALVGSPDRSYQNITEARYEPCIQVTELRYMNKYYNQTLVIPQAEWYVYLQLNYFTNFIKINDRLILGLSDVEDRENNSVYQVKAVVKANSQKTFARNNQTSIEDIPLIILALDKDEAADGDDLINRIPNQAPLYKVEQENPVYEYYIEMENAETEETVQPDVTTDLMLGEMAEFRVYLAFNVEKVDGKHKFVFEAKLGGIKQENWNKYFKCNFDEETCVFTIKNLKQCNRGVVNVELRCVDEDLTAQAQPVIQNYTFKLGGFY